MTSTKDPSASTQGKPVAQAIADKSQASEARLRRMARLAARRAKGTAPWQQEGPESPCVKVCRLEPQERWCEGCYRTPAEIRDWPILDAPHRQAILERIAAFRTNHGL